MTTYRIAEVSERTGYSPPTLRYYETLGLLPAPERTGNGYRVYDDTTLDRLGFITRAKQLGCSLDEIAELTRARESGHCAPVQSRLQSVIDAKVADTRARIVELTVLAADLRRAAATLGSHTPEGPCDDRCGCTSDPSAAAAPGAGAERGVEAAPVALTGKPGGAEVPIACSLGAGEQAGRLDEWSAVLDDERSVTRRVALDDGIRLELGPDSDLAEIARLAAAEQGCCRFFGFALVIDQRGTALEVHAPADGQTVLTALFGAAG